MIALKINDTKKMMQALLLGESFDTFFLQEAEVVKAATLYLEGRVREGYFADAAKESADSSHNAADEFVPYGQLRPLLAEYIKGDRVPLSFKFVLHAPKAFTQKLLSDPAFTGDPDLVKALILTFRFDANGLTALTGTSMKTFTPDRSLDSLWDAKIRRSLDNMQISFEEL